MSSFRTDSCDVQVIIYIKDVMMMMMMMTTTTMMMMMMMLWLLPLYC